MKHNNTLTLLFHKCSAAFEVWIFNHDFIAHSMLCVHCIHETN